jgi:tripeptide aminopeptidase
MAACAQAGVTVRSRFGAVKEPRDTFVNLTGEALNGAVRAILFTPQECVGKHLSRLLPRTIASCAHLVAGGRLTPELRDLERVRAAAQARLSSTVDLACRICEIPAPTGAEAERARFVAGILHERGYVTDIDDIANVYVRRGQPSSRAVMLVAHTDTVFPAGTAISVTRSDEILRGAGIGDNSLGVAAMIEALSILDELGMSPDGDIIAVANVGEEGLGNLRGVRAAVERYADSLSGVIAVEGHNFGRVTHAGVGSLRWRISVTGPGGHSWGAFGQPSAIHGLARIIAAIAELPVPEEPKTTFNVGTIEGGVSINTIAPRASALLDMRSIDPAALDDLAMSIRAVTETRAGEGLSVTVDVLGERPAGVCSLDTPLVRLAGDVLRALGFDPVFDASSTDANIPISRGIPAVCIGITRGGLGHTTDEYIEIPPIAAGVAQLAMLCSGATNMATGRG